MATSIKHPLREASAIKIHVFFWVWCLCVVVKCHSEDLPSELSRKTDNANSHPNVDFQLMPITLPVVASSAKKENGCYNSCHLSKNPVDEDNNEDITNTEQSNTADFPKSDTLSRHQRSVSETQQEQRHERPGRASALNKNFLRFGRGGLNKNFLRFGRGNLKQNFLRFGRGGLQKNFLRFGRKNGEEEFNSGEKSDMGDFEHRPATESLDLQTNAGNKGNLLRAIERLQSEIEENQASNDEKQENGSFPEEDVSGTTDQGESDLEMVETPAKRGSLNKNFLRFGRYYKSNVFSGKRGSLNRNFLRFGKRSGQPKAKIEEISNSESAGNKIVKRDVSQWGAKNELKDQGVNELSSTQQNKKSVLFLASPWLSKNGSDGFTHGDSIRRRSLDTKLLNQLHENFIRFGRR